MNLYNNKLFCEYVREQRWSRTNRTHLSKKKKMESGKETISDFHTNPQQDVEFNKRGWAVV